MAALRLALVGGLCVSVLFGFLRGTGRFTALGQQLPFVCVMRVVVRENFLS